jgi:hypothetical protein
LGRDDRAHHVDQIVDFIGRKMPARKWHDHDRRRPGCAAPKGLDLDGGARRGRIMGKFPRSVTRRGRR